MTYQKRCEIIKNLIDKTFPDNVEEYRYTTNSKDFLLMIRCLNGEHVIKSFEVDSDWEHIKRNIERSIKDLMSSDYYKCLICYNIIMKREICCKICRFIHCPDCFYKILRINKGIHACPKCRHIIDRRIGKVDWKFPFERDSEPDSGYDYHSYLLRILESSGAQLHVSPF